VRKQAATTADAVPNQTGAAPQAEDAVRVRQRVMADAIRALRPDARQGSLLTSEIGAVLRAEIEAAFNSPRSALIRDELEEQNEGRPDQTPPEVNQPSTAPRVPPVLLARLPVLPAQLEFAFSGRALLLKDVDANLVVDVVPDALPEAVLARGEQESAAAPT